MSDQTDPPEENVVEFRRKTGQERKPKRPSRRRPPTPAYSVGGSRYYAYKPGHNVVCRVVAIEPGGYAVIVSREALPGYLPSNAKHQIGDDVLATFVCVDKNRMLLSERFTHGKGGLAKRNYGFPDWSEELDKLGSSDTTGAQQPSGAQPMHMDGVPTKTFQRQCAIDLIMPPIETDTLRSMRISEYDVEWLLTQLEGGEHTGCVKAVCESRLSRAAMLLYKGRAVGCIYGCESDPKTKPTEEALQSMLSDLESPDTVVTLYDLPEAITLAMTSLFLGYPVERHDDYSAKEYLDYICNWLDQKNGTATLAISLTQERGTCLVYIFKGEYAGAFYVENQAYRADRAFVDEMLENDPRAGLEVSILPPEMHAAAVRFGFSLNMARTSKFD